MKKHHCHPLSLTGNLSDAYFPPRCQESAAALTRATADVLRSYRAVSSALGVIGPGGSWAEMCFSRLCSLPLQIQLAAFAASSPGMPGKAGVFLKSG